jgi:hypothetical protein
MLPMLPMSKLVPLREVTHLRLVPPSDEDGIGGRSWWPVSYTELHLASLYFPLAVRFDGGIPSLGLLLGETYLKRSAVDGTGKWQGGYKPIALRSAPFRCGETGGDALDLLIASPSPHLASRGGIPIVGDAGAVHPLIGEMHRWCRLLEEDEVRQCARPVADCQSARPAHGRGPDAAGRPAALYRRGRAIHGRR